tara:strand:- start:202 stop:420 length:219 start_codon:yes stop_codon:yes gene_type:complete
MITGYGLTSKMQMLVTVMRPTMRGMFAMDVVAMAMDTMAMVFVHMNTWCRHLMFMSYAYHHAGNNQRQPKKD